ncbi:MAG TPA: F0F1 ATP synthase subunit B [Anaerolineae bacterium]|nr:F0F1 ATP synthase subunit B [Anaerolineae bacterium]HID85485.1 F0F1 ATP synthase subunit B [Anaerolineales bacterium]HIQ07971.1 ATP synthase F0 subunit B [Anaerolineaceae bacterium]
MDKLGISLGYLIVQIFNFIVMFLVLKRFVYKPILGMLEKRRQAIAQGLEDARIAAEARANAEKEAEKIIAEAQAKAAQIVREASERAESVAREIKAAAEAEAAKAREQALAEVEAERNRMLGVLRSQVAALAIAAAQKLVGEALNEQRQHALIQEFFSGIKGGKVTVLDEVGELQGTEAEVVSALPLTEEEQETLRKDLLSKTGAQAVTFRVDPSIVGGLIIRVGDKVIDGSVAGQLQLLREKLG